MIETARAIREAQLAYIEAHPVVHKPDHWDIAYRCFHCGVVEGFTLALRVIDALRPIEDDDDDE